MKILLTGGTGNVGVAAVRRLVGSGHSVTVIGRRTGMDVPSGATYHQCDINEYDGLFSITRGHDSIVHLAAIPTPTGNPGREVFRVNDLGTFNVFEAAEELGISRVVGASSINAFGYFYGDRGFPIRYLPVDETHEGLATDAYSFSKQVMEDIGSYFWERAGISSVMLRLPAVISQERFGSYLDHVSPAREVADRILMLPDAEREAEVLRLSRAYDRWRREHRWDKIDRDAWRRIHEQEMRGDLDRAEFALMSSRANLFTYVHEDDSAQAIEQGLMADYEGSHPLYINVHRNTLGLPVEEMAKLFDPPTPEIRDYPSGDDTVLSITRARELLGFEPTLVAER